jgi:hypothetical protein
MVIYDADGLQKGVDDRCSDKPKPPPFQVLRDTVAELRAGGNASRASRAIDDGPTVNESPEVMLE